MATNKRIVEINGVKFEIDTRSAKIVDELRVGSAVKCLVKEYSEMKVYPGVIIGFNEFKSLPTITVAYLKTEYSSCDLIFKSFNSETKDFEFVLDSDQQPLEVDKERMLTYMDREITKCELAAEAAQQKKQFFIDKFSALFNPLGTGEIKTKA
jgi:hypothetical protein